MLKLFANPLLRLYTGALLISFSPVFVRLVDVPPTTSGFYRVLFGGLALVGYLLITRQRLSFNGQAWRALALATLFFAGDIWFWHRSILYIGPGLSTLIANLQVFFMMAAGALFLAQSPTRRQLLAVPLAVAGLTMIVGPDWQAVTPGYRIGVVLALLTAMTYAGYLLSLRAARVQSTHAVPIREVGIVSLAVAAVLGASALVEGVPLTIPSVRDGTLLVTYGLMSQAIGWLFITSSLTRVTATQTGIALLLQPALSFLWDILVFDRATSGIEYAGVAITLAAIFLGGRASSPRLHNTN